MGRKHNSYRSALVRSAFDMDCPMMQENYMFRYGKAELGIEILDKARSGREFPHGEMVLFGLKRNQFQNVLLVIDDSYDFMNSIALS